MKNGKRSLITVFGVSLWTLASLTRLTTPVALAQDPAINVDPASFAKVLLEGQQTTDILTIENLGDAELEYDLWVHNPDPASEDALIAVTTSAYPEENIQLENTMTALGYNYVYVNSVAEAIAADADAILGRFGGTVLDPTEIESWVLSGHGYLHLGDWSSWLAVSSTATGGAEVTVDVVDPNSPLTLGLPPSWNTYGIWHYSGSGWLAWMTDTGYENIASATLDAVTYDRSVSHLKVGNGFVAFIGFNVYGIDAPAPSLQLFANALDWITTGAWSSWLSFDPTEGTVPVGETRQVTVTFDASELGGGTYNLELMVASNDPVDPLITVPVTLQVIGTPEISCDPTELDFGIIYYYDTATLEVDVANIGTDLLVVTELQTTPPWSTSTPIFDLMPGEHETVVVDFIPAAPGEYTGTLDLLCNDPVNPIFSIALQGIAQIPPIVAVDPDAVYKEMYQDCYGEELLTVTNAGQAELEVTLLVRNMMPQPATGPSGDELRDIIHNQEPAVSSQPPHAGRALPAPVTTPASDSRNIIIAVTTSGFPPEDLQLQATLTEFGYDFVYITTVAEAVDAGALAIIGRFGGVDLDQDDLTDWIEAGGGYIQMGDWCNWFPDNWTFIDGAPVEVQLQDAAHPIATGLPATWTAAGYWHYSRGDFLGWVTTPAFHDVADADVDMTTYERVVTADQIAAGYAVYLGFNVYGADVCDESKQLLENALQWVITGDVVTWVRPAPNTLLIPGGESFDVTLLFDSHGLAVGEHNAELTLLTNDPDTPELDVPVTLTVLPDQECQPCVNLLPLACGETVSDRTDRFCNLSAWDFYAGWPDSEQGPELVYHFTFTSAVELYVEWLADEMLHAFLLEQCDPDAVLAAGSEFIYLEFLPAGEYYLALDGPGLQGVAFELLVSCGYPSVVEPTEFALERNYPNPFNPATTIQFSLAEPVPVSLVVYNLKGQQVATLVEEPLPVGVHSVQFDGSALPSGLYFYTLRAGDYTATRKMALVK